MKRTMAGRIAAVVVTVAAAAPSASAAPARTSCRMVPDHPGDVAVTQLAPSATVPDDALDMLSADLASNRTTLTFVLRVKKLVAPPPTSPSGATYRMYFTLNTADTLYFVSVYDDLTGASADYGVATILGGVLSQFTVYGTAQPVLDFVHNEVRLSAPLKQIFSGVLLVPGRTAAVPVATNTGRHYGSQYAEVADTSKEGQRYVLGSRSCVKVGA
ncbi:MAG: hypothetical protein QOE64_1653 [Frankiales bacterium]|jgi:hypothetical protein|nr:hypothetical protein [Frankiales bacterium]